MLPIGSGSLRRPHPDSDSDAEGPNEEARRVRSRTTPGTGEGPSGLAPRGALPGGSQPGSPRRSSVSGEQLQQWTNSARPRSGRVAAPGAWAALPAPVVARAADAAGPSGAAAQRVAADTLGVPPEGCNTLVVYAMERKLLADGVSKSRMPELRSALTRFGDALRRQDPPVTLAGFLDGLSSDAPMERLATAALKDSTVRGLHFSSSSVRLLETALDALSELPREQRMLTLEQALLSKMQAPALKTLLPEGDRRLLQQVQDLDSNLTPIAAGTNQVLLIRLGIALMADGRGGLPGWLALHNERDGYRQAKELLERFRDSPTLALSDSNKRRLGAAAERLQACDLGLPEALPAPADASQRRAPLAPRFPSDFPPAEASLIDARLQAGLDNALSRATLSTYGRELIQLSEWLRKPADADRPARPSGLQALLDLSREDGDAELRELVNAFIASRPARNKARPAVELLLNPPASEPADAPRASTPPPPVPQSPQWLPPSSPVPAVDAGPAQAGPSGVAASAPASSWSLGSLIERMGGHMDIEACIQELDEAMSAYQAPAPSGAAPTSDLDALYQQLLTDEDTQALLQGVAGTLAQGLPQEPPPETSPAFDALLGEFAELVPADPPGAATGAEAPVVKVLPPEAAVQYFNSRLQDVQMMLRLSRAQRGEAVRFAQHLASGDRAHEGLNGFLQRYESSDPALRREARIELEHYLSPKGRSVLPGGRTDLVVSGLETLAGIPAAQRDWNDPARRLTSEQVNSKYRPWLLPPQDSVLLQRLTNAQRMNLSRFTRQMLGAGQGGLTNWLVLFHEGQGRLARGLMLDFVKADPNNTRKGSLSLAGDRLQAMSSMRSGLRLAVQGTGRTTIGAVARPSPGQPAALPAAGGSALPGPSSSRPRPLALQQRETAPLHALPLSTVRLPPPALPAEPQAGTSSPPGSAEPSSVPLTAIPLAGANTLMAYLLAERLELDGKSKSTVMNVRNALMSFGEELLRQEPPLSLAGFLEQRSSGDAVQRGDAGARQAAIVQSWANAKRNDALLALRMLGELPPGQRMWSLGQALRSKMQAPALKTLVPQGDQRLLDRVTQLVAGQVSGAMAGRHQVMLIRFAVALMARGGVGLSHWLEMHDDAQGHVRAKELLEGFLTDPLFGSQARKDSFLAAIKRLHEVAQMPETEQLHPQLRAPADPAAPVAVRFPDDFPPAEAELVNARLAAGKASRLSTRTLENYGRDLIRLSEWLRKPDDSARPAQPSGLLSLTALAQAGNEAELKLLREAFFGRGKPGNAPGALDLLVGLRVGSL